MQFLFFISILFLSGISFGIDVTSSNTKPLDLTARIETSLQPADRSDPENFEFQKQTDDDLKLSYTDQALWIRFVLENPSAEKMERFVYFSSALTGKLELFHFGKREIQSQTGSSVPLLQRSLPTRHSAFLILLKPNEVQTFLIKRTSVHNLSSKLYLGTRQDFDRTESDSKAVLFFYFGGILCLMIYNLFVGLYAKDWNYLFYVFFAGALATAALTTQGFFDAYLFQNVAFSDHLMVASSTAILASLLFVYRFLNIPVTFPKSRVGFYLLSLSALCTLFVGFFGMRSHFVFFGFFIDLTVAVLLVFLVTCGIVAYRHGHRLAKFFLISWVSIVVGVFSWLGMTYGFLANSTFTTHALMFGNMGEMLILSLGLAFKINILDREKNEALIQAREKERYHRLVKVLSHDVANAITIFSNYLTRLRRTPLAEPTVQVVEKLEATVNNMRDMLGLVRDEEVLNSFRLSVNLRQVDLLEVIQEVISYCEESIAQKNLKVEVRVPEKTFVLAERTALVNQVLTNILTNAVKFSFSNSKVKIFLETLPQSFVLKIQDFGCGLKAEDIQRIFFSNETISRPGTLKEKGSGMGISLVKEYMAIFRGQMQVESSHESNSKYSGTTISLIFPRVP